MFGIRDGGKIFSKLKNIIGEDADETSSSYTSSSNDVEEEKEEGVKKVSSLFVSAVSFRGNGIR